MKLALLGIDRSARQIARAAAGAGQRLVWGCELGDFEPEFRNLAPDAVVAQHWEDLLSGNLADALVVARGAEEDQRADQLRKLFQAGLPMLVSHPIHSSMLVSYELDMIRRESGACVLPYVPHRWHPAVERLLQLLSHTGAADAAAASGRLEQVVIERHMADRSRAAVQAQFAADIDLARLLCGELNKIAAMAPAGAAEPYANLGVQLSGPSGTLVRWSVGPVEEAAGARLLLFTPAGRIVLWMPDAAAPWTLQWPQRQVESFDADDRPPRRALERLANELARSRTKGNPSPPVASPFGEQGETFESTRQALAPQDERAPPDWTDACRAIELADSLDRSLQKGRTLELHFDDYTEQGTFKGTMTSLGCGLLVLLLVMLPVIAIADRAGVPWARYWAYIVLAICVLFLLLQGLRLVFSEEERQ
jgi:myo-inositol 2-dehydrogenase/D-chiro-inositol 1-dehydrogenase